MFSPLSKKPPTKFIESIQAFLNIAWNKGSFDYKNGPTISSAYNKIWTTPEIPWAPPK